MAVYFDYKIQSPTVAFHKHIACHNNYPLVAVASESEPDSGGSITLYLDEGELLEDSMIQRVAVVSSLSWHPSRKIVASGWKSGEILIWNEHDHDLHEAVLHHKTPVVILAWNSTGSRLVSGDEAGVLNIWKADQKGRLQQAPMHKHEVNSSITQLVFQLTSGPELAADLAAAARAAVSGDESALDMFSWKKSSSNMKFNMTSADNIQLYFGTVDGNVYGVDDRGKLSNKFKLDGAVRKLLYHESKELIITVTDSFHLSQHGLGEDGEVTEISKVKLSGQPGKGEITWAGPGLIAMVSGEQVVRMLDIEHDESYLLHLEISMGFENGECIGCIAYSPQKRIIAGGTNKGKVAMWKYNPSALDKYNSKGSHGSAGNEKLWELLSPAEVEGTVTALQWGAGKGFLAVNTGTDVVVLNESVMNSHFNQQVGAVQVSPSQMTIEIFSTNFLHDLKTDIHIKGMFVTKNHATIWNGRKVVVYEVAQDKSLIRAVGTFNSDSTHIAVNDQSLYLLEAGKITVRTFQGTTKQELAFTEQEGDPVLMGTCGSFLAVGSNKGVVKMFDLSRREARQHGPAKYFDEIIPNFGHFRTVKNNCNGTKVGVLSAEAGGSIDSKVYVWDIETDSVQNFDFFYGNGPCDIDENLQIAQEQLTADIKDRTARSLFWDPGEPKLLICEAICSGVRRADKGKTEKNVTLQRSKDDTKEDVLIISLFSTPDSGIIVQDHFAMDSEHTGLLGTDIPYFYFARKSFEEDKAGSLSSGSSSVKHLISRRTMRDFIGLENADASTKDAMINFSYLSAVGNMDDAFKAIKAIKSGSVWENMARMCVKTKRLDVAAVCLGNMGNARGAKALREAMSEPELDAKVAALALQLGMHDEAERLYQNCGRHDLLNEFYQASNNWPKAMEEAEMYDRIHLRTTYYNYGKYLESVGNFGGAIQYYEKSETHRFEVPRMLFEDPDQLEAYIMKSKDKQLRKWWAQYMESIGEMETALQFYQSAQDNLALVRVYCYCGNLDKAADICNETGDKAACYHLARQFENQENVKGAIHYFSRAQAYSNGIRLAKENELDNELMNLALLSSPEDMIDAARYFESKAGMHDKAVMLYHKGGRISKAVDLAFRTEQFGALQLISEDLDENTDPEMLNKCAEFFIEHGQFDKAVELLVVGRRYHDALEMCMDHHVNITEDIAEKMTLPKDYEDQQYRTQLLERIAECAFKQGSFHLATKKFTQAGNKLKAMKSLLKSGDTEKIVFFAGVSRQREIYVMAANYLQSLDWRKDPEIMKNIIGFYTKGRALDSLASFYEACAQVEIDEYQNYEKAFGALTEAYKSLSKAKVKNSAQQEERLATLKQKLTLIKKFLQAKKMLVEDPDEAIKQCQLLLDDPDMESSVRLGDAYGLMIEHFVSKQSYKQAYQLMQDLRQRAPSINMAFYVSMKSIEAVHKALDIPLGRGVGAEKTRNGMMNGDTDQDIVDDEVIDESYDAQDDDYI